MFTAVAGRTLQYSSARAIDRCISSFPAIAKPEVSSSISRHIEFVEFSQPIAVLHRRPRPLDGPCSCHAYLRA